MDSFALKTLISRVKPLARECAELLDSSGSENEFRLKCAALGKDPKETFRPYAQYVKLARGYLSLGIQAEFKLSDWWAFEKIPGAVKPDPWLSGYVDNLRRA